MKTNLKHSLRAMAFLAIGALLAACTKDPTGTGLSGATHGTGDAHAIFDIPAPTNCAATQGSAIGSNYAVNVSWTYQTEPDAYYTSTQYYAANGDAVGQMGHVPTSALNAGASNSPYEFWGGSQQSIAYPGNSYSGHYEVSRSTDGGVTWTGLPDINATSFTDNNGGSGFSIGTTVSYQIDEKSNEGVEPNAYTHHSGPSNTGSVTIATPCVEVPIANTYAASGAGNGNGSWSGTTWTTNSSNSSHNTNIMFDINEWTNTQNSCTNAITSTPVSGGYEGNLYLSDDGGTTWRTQAWTIDGYYQSNGNNPGGNGTGLGKLPVNTYTVIYSSSASLAGELGTFTIVVTP